MKIMILGALLMFDVGSVASMSLPDTGIPRQFLPVFTILSFLVRIVSRKTHSEIHPHRLILPGKKVRYILGYYPAMRAEHSI